MGLARQYAKIFRSQLLHHAAWSPVTDAFGVGDYGAIRQGVFQRLGNIREFGVEPVTRTGASSVSFDFTSAGTVMVRTAAGAKVPVFPAQPVHAELEIGFEGDSCVLVRTGRLTVTELTAVDSVARQLLGRRDPDGRKWRLGWRIIRKLYVADAPVILAAAERGARVSLTGRADALARFEAGEGSAGITVGTKTTAALQIIGGRGPVAFDLFKVRLTGNATLESFDPRTQSDPEAPTAEPELDDEWPADLDDDPDDLFPSP